MDFLLDDLIIFLKEPVNKIIKMFITVKEKKTKFITVIIFRSVW